MPAIPQALSGLRPHTARNLILDAGQCWINPNLAALRSTGLWSAAASTNWTHPDGPSLSPRLAGGTRGGTTVRFNRTTRQVDADGRRTDLKGFARIDEITVDLETSLIEMGDEDTMQMSMGSVQVDEWPASGTKKMREMTPILIPNDTDYLGTIGVVATVSGEDQPCVVILENPMVVGNTELPFADKTEMAARVIFRAHALLASPLDIPGHVFMPIEYAS